MLMLPRHSLPASGLPPQILEQRDPGVIYFFSKMTKETQLDMKKKEEQLAEKNLEIKRLEMETHCTLLASSNTIMDVKVSVLA